MKVDVFANPFLPELHLFHDRERYRRFCERKFGKYEDLGGEGQTIYADGVAAVLVEPPQDSDLPSDFALIAHESYHVACLHFMFLGVTEYDDEIMAYAVQVISGSLCVAHMKWLTKKGSQTAV